MSKQNFSEWVLLCPEHRFDGEETFNTYHTEQEALAAPKIYCHTCNQLRVPQYVTMTSYFCDCCDGELEWGEGWTSIPTEFEDYALEDMKAGDEDKVIGNHIICRDCIENEEYLKLLEELLNDRDNNKKGEQLNGHDAKKD
jgi:hypothetical protein